MHIDDSFLEWVEEMLEEELIIEEMVSEVFQDEQNYNNADTTSGQTCYTESEIKDILLFVIDEFKNDGDHCFVCGVRHRQENYITCNELRVTDPYPMYETVVTGHHCDFCGHTEDF